MDAKDKAGVLSKVSSVLSKHNISVAEVIQENKKVNGVVPLILVTHETFEKNVNKAVDEINSIENLAKVASVIRVVS